MQIRWFDVGGGNLSTQMLDHSNLDFPFRKELVKFNKFLYFNLMQDD